MREVFCFSDHMHSIADKEIHLWTVQLDDPALNAEEFRPLLSADECKKADRYHFEKDRRCYTLTRGIQRQLIGRYLNRAPESIVFEYNSHGKPLLPGRELAFNATHSGDKALLVFSTDGNIGIDLERIRPDFDFSRIQHRYFSADQVAEISASPDPRTTFFQLWTLKEAFIKAIGSGIFYDLNAFDVPLEAPCFSDPKTGKEWQVQPLTLYPGFAAAIIHDLPGATIQTFSYP